MVLTKSFFLNAYSPRDLTKTVSLPVQMSNTFRKRKAILGLKENQFHMAILKRCLRFPSNYIIQVKRVIVPRQIQLSFNQLLNTVITLRQEVSELLQKIFFDNQSIKKEFITRTNMILIR